MRNRPGSARVWVRGRYCGGHGSEKTRSLERACAEQSYRLRIVELQARYRLVPMRGPFTFRCEGEPRSEVIVNYFATEPGSLLAERGDAVSLMIQAPVASGTLYTGRNESIREHQGEALIRWGHGAPEMRCVPAPG